jgi:AAA domain
MPNLSAHPSTELVKLLLLGDSKSGKTGSLVSLVAAGYKLRILDFDSLLDILRYKVMEICPALVDNVEFRTLRDAVKAGLGGAIIDGKPKAWISAIKMLDHWRYDDVDLGVPGSWGPDAILVIDSLSRLCDSAYDYHESIAPIGKSGEYDGRAVYGSAQDDVEKVLGMLTSPGFNTNVIVICHGVYMEQPDGTFIFPQGVGQKLSPKIPQYFPNYVRYINRGGKRTIQLESDSLIHLGNARPSQMPKTLPIETGLADFFAVLRDPPAKSVAALAQVPPTRVPPVARRI